MMIASPITSAAMRTRKDRKNQSALYGLARVYRSKKDYGKSIKYIKKYIFLKPKGVKGRYIYMVTLYNMKDYREALKQVQVIENLKSLKIEKIDSGP